MFHAATFLYQKFVPKFLLVTPGNTKPPKNGGIVISGSDAGT